MESIKLTEEHRDKLLEMCKVLFPETYTKTWDIKGLFDYEPINNETFQCFHWFEFCITKLWLKIALYVNHEPTAIRSIILEKVHPVDYLYGEFKTKTKKLIIPEKSVDNETLDHTKYKPMKK